MSKVNNGRAKWIWLSVLILLVCIAATSIAIFSRLDIFNMDDEGAISLIDDNASKTDESENEADNGKDSEGSGMDTDPENGAENENGSDGSGSGSSESDDASEETEKPTNPGFEVSDDNTVWSTDTQVEIFRISYENGEKVITVNSDDGEKVIAPGTENSYVFKLKNTGDVALDYTVEVDAYFLPGDVKIPVTARLSRYDGKWIAGGRESFAEVPELDAAEDMATLGAGKYTYYTLDWCWPFESGNDELDTMLGNMAVDEDLIFAIEIKTTATESDDPNAGSGITPPQTGDDSRLAMWSVLAVCSFAMIIFFVFCPNREKRKENAEASKN